MTRFGVSLIAALLIAAPASADINASLRFGKSVLRITDGGFQARVRLGKRHDDHRERRHRRKRSVILPPTRTRVVRETVVREVPVPAAPITPPPPPEPLNPVGESRILGARGRAHQPEIFELGSVLPRSRPHVTLDARRYGLPEPPVGQIYARVGRTVLRIDATDRRVIAVVAN